ncbi:unnamed protein product [Cuscuta campestris]|uniref:Retrotransposon gag domain-containing protein n=1 Tax=Cuscuta campestris TaxID=132261 RepID=A0A484MPV9_9ASTE|nr:unnamed protein product [Cuscuta campestris]
MTSASLLLSSPIVLDLAESQANFIDETFQLHGYPEGCGGCARDEGSCGWSRGHWLNIGRSPTVSAHTAHVAAVTANSGQKPTLSNLVPSLTADQWDTFRALLASVKDGTAEKLSAQDFSFDDNEGAIHLQLLPRGFGATSCHMALYHHWNELSEKVFITFSFSQPNYKKWSRLFLLLARRFNLQGYLKGSIAPISDDDDKWFQLDVILQGWILSTITDEVSDLVLSSVSTASTLWTMIHDLFHDNKHAQAMQLEHQFRTTVKGSTPMAAYCQELRNIADWLDDVDAPVCGQLSSFSTGSGLLWAKPAARPCWKVGTPAATAAASTAGVAATVLLTVTVGIGFLAATSAMAPPLDSVVALDADRGVATATGVEVEGVQTAA